MKGRIPELDGLRGIAILMVLLVHFGMFQPHGHLEAAVFRFFEMGWAGVDLFFVLSGYLITAILLDSKKSASYYHNFYVRRFLRIFPLYYVFLTVFLLVSLTRGIPVLEQLWYWVYAANFRVGLGHRVGGLTHFWSLAIEEQFYLIWPLIVRRLSPRNLVVLCVLLCVAGFCLRWELSRSQAPDSEFLYTFTPCRVDSLAIGALVAILLRADLKRRTLTQVATAGVCVGSLLLTYAINRNHSTFYTLPEIERFGYLGFDLLSAGVVLLSVINSGVPSFSVLRSRSLTLFGKYSYGIYVLHMPIAFYLAPRIDKALGFGLVSGIASATCGIALSFVAALFSWWALEARFLRLKERWTAGRRGDALLSAARAGR